MCSVRPDRQPGRRSLRFFCHLLLRDSHCGGEGGSKRSKPIDLQYSTDPRPAVQRDKDHEHGGAVLPRRLVCPGLSVDTSSISPVTVHSAFSLDFLARTNFSRLIDGNINFESDRPRSTEYKRKKYNWLGAGSTLPSHFLLRRHQPFYPSSKASIARGSLTIRIVVELAVVFLVRCYPPPSHSRILHEPCSDDGNMQESAGRLCAKDIRLLMRRLRRLQPLH